MTNTFLFDNESCENIFNMLNSSDLSNETVVEEILNHIDVEKNLIYLLIIYKECTYEQRKRIFDYSVIKQITRFIDFKAPDENISNDAIYKAIRHNKNVSPESLDFFIERLSKSLRKNLIQWGFSFLEDFEIKLIKKE